MTNRFLRQATFDGCDLRDARFTGCYLVAASFQNANLDRCHLEHADLRLADFRGASGLPTATLDGSWCENARFDREVGHQLFGCSATDGLVPPA